MLYFPLKMVNSHKAENLLFIFVSPLMSQGLASQDNYTNVCGINAKRVDVKKKTRGVKL